MKNYNEMANDVLRRIEEHHARKERRKKMYIKTAASVAAMVIVVIAGIHFGQMNPLVTDHQTGTENHSMENEQNAIINGNQGENVSALPDRPVVWGDTSNDNMEMAIISWNGKQITSSLYDAFQKNEENSMFAIAAYCMKTDETYVFKGKTLAEYESEMLYEQELIDKLQELIKAGDSLKYGEDLYLTGTPDGEKWIKELYDETVSWYGEDILDKYIPDGEFLKEKLETDLENLYKEEALQQYEMALSAYTDAVNMALKEELEKKNIVSEVSATVGYLLVYATEEEFAVLELEHPSVWEFGLAVRETDGPLVDMDDVE